MTHNTTQQVLNISKILKKYSSKEGQDQEVKNLPIPWQIKSEQTVFNLD